MTDQLDHRSISEFTNPANEEWISNIPAEVVDDFETWFTMLDMVERLGEKYGVEDAKEQLLFARNWARRIRRSVTSVGGFRSKQMVEVATKETGSVMPGSYRAPGTIGQSQQAPSVNIINNPAKPAQPRQGVMQRIRSGFKGE